MTARGPRSVAVIGGGITGLTAAWWLLERSPRTHVTLFEAGERVGGKIRSIAVGRGAVDAGPDSFVAREPMIEEMCARLGLADDLIEPDVFAAGLWLDGDVRRLPRGSFWGLPVDTKQLRAAPLSPGARVRMLADLLSPGPLRGRDVSVGGFVRRRFGRAVAERLVDPLLAGTRAGDLDRMSLAAALPQLDAIARRYRSVIRGVALERRRGSEATAPPRFLGIKGGMQRIVDALSAALDPRAEVATSAAVARVRAAGDGFTVDCESGDSTTVDAVIVCAPAPRAATILDDLSAAAAALLRAIRYAPVASIALVYPEGSFDPPADTSGVLVPRRGGLSISACTWWTTKWRGSVPGSQVVRCFVGRTDQDDVPGDDEALAASCARDVTTILGTRASPIESLVTRWGDGLPQYEVGHLDGLAAIARALRPHPGLALAGAGYRGSGLTDCVAQARRAAEDVIAGGNTG